MSSDGARDCSGSSDSRRRRHFEARLSEELSVALRHGDDLSIVMLDLDHFKLLNDAHGHPFGDRVLKSVATTLQDGAYE